MGSIENGGDLELVEAGVADHLSVYQMLRIDLWIAGVGELGHFLVAYDRCKKISGL